MNFLRIEQTYGKIGVETYASQLGIESRQSILKVHQEHVQVEIDKEEPKVLIDQHECFATAGLKNHFELAQEAAAAAARQVMEYTARYASDGDLLAKIQYKGNPIAEIARRNSFDSHEFNIDLIPKARPRIEVEGHINLSFKEGGVQTGVEEGFMQINFSKPQIQCYLLQKPSLQIQYVGKNLDIYA